MVEVLLEKMKAKPDCTKQRFGMLTVLGKGEWRRTSDGRNRQLWLLQCDCGTIIERPRGNFDRFSYQRASCGCARRLGLIDNKRRPQNISGQKFGNLTAIALTGKKDSSRKPTWRFQCDCGNLREMSLSDIRRHEREGIRINCGDPLLHLDRWLRYPPTPNPYPQDAGELLVKYLDLTKLDYKQIDTEVEDEKLNRLIRAAWIIAYRRSLGEIISQLHEERIIKKYLRYCSIIVFWKRKVEEYGGLMYDGERNKKQIGFKMTDITSNVYPGLESQENFVDLTSSNYPVIETQEINCISMKKLRFKRR
ncbi:hypothetical protein [Chroococcidiopsis sp.]|uniref:hypothetical protein n=1 Tax=Chroococcidiopsis sp. TaxID=3088168 RepID=UPI003F40B27E